MIPCEECLKYALCKHKTHINCTDLASWYTSHAKPLKKYFPIVETIALSLRQNQPKLPTQVRVDGNLIMVEIRDWKIKQGYIK